MEERITESNGVDCTSHFDGSASRATSTSVTSGNSWNFGLSFSAKWKAMDILENTFGATWDVDRTRSHTAPETTIRTLTWGLNQQLKGPEDAAMEVLFVYPDHHAEGLRIY